MIDPKRLKQTIAQIHKQYPEFAGCQPKVRKQSPPANNAASLTQNYLLTFSTIATTNSSSGSKSMPRYLRVVVSEAGKIIKVTTSR